MFSYEVQDLSLMDIGKTNGDRVIIAETDRLILRHFCRQDLEALAPILAEPKVMKFSLKGVKNKAETAQFIKFVIANYRSKGYSLYAVIHRGDRRLIGYCGFFFWFIAGREEVEIGYRFDPNYWGRGLATEAAKAVRDYGFKNLTVSSFISIIEAENIASIRVAEKNGMKYEKNWNFQGIPVRIYRIFRNK